MLLKQTIFLHIEKVRDITLKKIESTPESMIHFMPKGVYNNGYLSPLISAEVQDRLTFCTGETKRGKDNDFSKVPHDWRGEPPSKLNLRNGF